MAGTCDSAHQDSIGGGGAVGDDSGERRQRGRDGAAASARSPAREGAMQGNKQPWELY
jgi:hypothetical protein